MPKILAIDDINDNLISLKAIIKDAFPDSTVFTAQNGPNGIELAIAEDPEVILLDIVMPGMDGFEVCRQLKLDERVRDIPVIFLTALKGDKENRIKALDAGAEAFLSKPIDETELTAQIKAMVKIKVASELKRTENVRLKRLVSERTQKLELSQIAALNLLNELKAENEAHKKTETALKKSEERFRHISSSISDISYSCKIGIEGKSSIDWLYGATEKITGYTADELFEMKCWGKIVLDEDFPLFHKHILEVPPGSTDSCQLRLKKKDGSIFWVQASSECVKEIDSAICIIYGGLVDINERRQAEEKIRESEKRYRLLVEQSPTGIAIYQEGKFVYVNAAGLAIFGASDQQELIGKPVLSIVHPDSRDLVIRRMGLVAKGIAVPLMEEKLIRFDGSIFDAEVIALNTIYNDKPAGQVMVMDITERKRAEDVLKQSEDRYRSFISQVSEGVYRFESDRPMDLNLSVEDQIDYIYDHMFIAECNNALLKMYKVDKQEDILGKTQLYFHGGRNNKINRASLRNFIENGYTVENEITEEMNVLGKLMYFSNNSIGIIENNQLVRIWGTQIDITEKMRNDMVQQVLYAISNAALSSIELTELVKIIRTQLGKLLDSTNFYIAFYDEASGMLSTEFDQDEKDQFDCWPAEKSATGYVIRHKKSLLALETDVKKLQEAGEIDMVGTPSKVWLGVPMILNNKAIGAIVVQSYDNPDAYAEKDKLMLEFISDQISITIERKRAEKELREALKKAQESDSLKSAFLANMSHEIRTPLNSIIGFSDLLLDPFFGSEQHTEFAGIIKDNGNNLLTIISDIMDLSKIEAGQVKVKKAILSINNLINDILREFSFKAIEKGIELRLNLSNLQDEIFINSDEVRLRQVLINLVGNAIKFTGKGFVEIGFSKTGDFVQFQVSDTGIGIPTEFHDAIFERFRQVETAHTRKYGGNGLGLAITKSLVEILGGSVRMESEPGVGSTFYFKIPK